MKNDPCGCLQTGEVPTYARVVARSAHNGSKQHQNKNSHRAHTRLTSTLGQANKLQPLSSFTHVECCCGGRRGGGTCQYGPPHTTIPSSLHPSFPARSSGSSFVGRSYPRNTTPPPTHTTEDDDGAAPPLPWASAVPSAPSPCYRVPSPGPLAPRPSSHLFSQSSG
jgi:hypothetical protein